MQNWKNISQVMYIGITSLKRGRQTRKDLHFLGIEEVNRHRGHSYGRLKRRVYFTTPD